jgi:polar amino acid transport system substrate-binding protein
MMATDGRLRVASLARPRSTALAGLNDSLAHELASGLDRAFASVEYRSSGQLLCGAATGEWDVACVALNGERSVLLEFTPPYMYVEGAYLVPATGPIRSIEDADRQDVRIAVARESPAGDHLARRLRQGRLRRVASEKVAMRCLNRGDAEVVAGLRVDLLQLADENNGYWVLMDPLFELSYALAVPRGIPDLLEEAKVFVGRIAESGLVVEYIDRNHWAGVRAAEIRPTMSAGSVALRRGGS